MVTPCPLCHLNLDGFQPKAASQRHTKIDPAHFAPCRRLWGLAMGMDPKGMGLSKHIVPTKRLLSKVALSA